MWDSKINERWGHLLLADLLYKKSSAVTLLHCLILAESTVCETSKVWASRSSQKPSPHIILYISSQNTLFQNLCKKKKKPVVQHFSGEMWAVFAPSSEGANKSTWRLHPSLMCEAAISFRVLAGVCMARYTDENRDGGKQRPSTALQKQPQGRLQHKNPPSLNCPVPVL